MPDWSYRPLLRPLLFWLPPDHAQRLTLTVLSRVGTHPRGRQLLDLVGRLRPHPSLQRVLLGFTFRAPVGLGAGVDVGGQAAAGLCTFGLGFLEVGPLTLDPVPSSPQDPLAVRNPRTETLQSGHRLINQGVHAARVALAGQHQPGVPLLARLAHAPDATGPQVIAEWHEQIQVLQPVVDLFTLDITAAAVPQLYADTLRRLAAASARPVLLAVPPDLSAEHLASVCAIIRAAALPGVLIKDTQASSQGQTTGPASFAPTLQTLGQVRQQLGPEALIVAGSAHTPEEIHSLLASGANLVHLRAGLIYHGPGLAHRVHETLALSAPPPPTPRGWLWMLLLGLGLTLGGVLASWIGLQWVVLPYDEAFLRQGGPGLEDLNPARS
ncbi:hypothetical protein GO986_20375 [Deinococcus sp. HMF7620]|uniref:Dihydroorotate dehydrogenase catalytic domain-containing protein n=1 Tax=Deinococcus arboris TaxID=2682977 RepID=A0A7C9LXE1_9DEIO|nr:hypothetical protein [Deinococcus arboris]MVN89100.1 hypothetical protein [Deinococcus arboris]